MTDASASPDLSKTQVLIEALPYFQRYAGRTFVVKYGGHAMGNAEAARDFAEDIVLLKTVGINPVVVHGGGPQIGEMLSKLGVESTFVDGLRVTDAQTLEAVRMTLVGKVNRDLVSKFNMEAKDDPVAVGVSGEDGGLLVAKQAKPELEFVGDVDEDGAGEGDSRLQAGRRRIPGNVWHSAP